MAPNKNVPVSSDSRGVKKRKNPPSSSSNGQNNASRGRAIKRVKMHDARTIMTQTADAALNNGELDLQSFLKSREFEIKALEDGMQKSKKFLNTRAFQEVPRDMRRRTASHNVKRVPKRMQQRAAREMKEDNTPTVVPNKRKPGSSRGRVRAETAKRLGILAEKKRAMKAKEGVAGGIETRAARPKIRRNAFNDPPKPKSKFRKRQIHKTWLPTHLWLTKRAKMTEPKNPVWRFAIPITSTEKSYRPTHRAGGARGAVAWDMSYMSTIGLEGPAASLEKMMKSVGITEAGLWDTKGEKWKQGKRSWRGWLIREVNHTRIYIGPSTVLWCPSEQNAFGDEAESKPKKPPKHRVFVRVHPATFLETWTELLRLSKLQRPAVHIEDLRFEIGSIDITGPGSTEALLGILHPCTQTEDISDRHAETFRALAGVTNPGSLPPNAVLAFNIMDPRLRYPPRPVTLPKPNDEDANFALLNVLSTWPVDSSIGSSALFDRNARFKATRLPAQKSVNRRKSATAPGAYPPILTTDPPIPIILLTSRMGSAASTQGTWTLLAPWKCILPIWYGLVHYPLSSGGNPRFGGLEELRQIHFEHSVPWFPADYPGTHAGFAWEAGERLKRKAAWDRRPKGKRLEWTSVDLGAGRKGEIGFGWSCDFERLVGSSPSTSCDKTADAAKDTQDTETAGELNISDSKMPIEYLPTKAFTALLSSPIVEPLPPTTVATVRIILISRGVATPCARIYRLPQSSISEDPSKNGKPPATARDEWLSLLPPSSKSKPPPNPKSKAGKPHGRMSLNIPLPLRIRLLAQSLLQDPPLHYPADKDDGDGHPLVPDEDDLIGFVTKGEFNLAEGKGVAIGTIAVAKVLEEVKRAGKKESRLCIVRNAGEKIGRLGRWEPI